MQLSHLWFADDSVLFSEDAKTHDTLQQQLADICKTIGLYNNKSQTKMMTRREEITLIVDNDSIEFEVLYLFK